MSDTIDRETGGAVTGGSPTAALMDSANKSEPTTLEEKQENVESYVQFASLPGNNFPPTEERAGPDGAEEEPPRVIASTTSAPIPTNNMGSMQDVDEDDAEDEDEGEEQYDTVPPTFDRLTSSHVLPWGAPKERSRFPSSFNIETDIRPGEFVMRTLFAEFTVQAGKKISSVMVEPLDKALSKSLQRGEDPQFDQILSAFGTVAEHCLPSLLKTLFAWYERQGVEWIVSDYKGKGDSKGKSELSGARSELEFVSERRDLAVEFIFCLVLIEVLKQLSVHPGHEDLVQYLENIAFKHFRYRDSQTLGPNAANIHMMADLYAEVLGILSQSRFLSTKKKFFTELRELRSREPSAHTNTTQSIVSLMMGMKFFRVKMVPFEDFEHSFQFMQELAQYFLEVRDKDIKHAVAGLFVEILNPVAAAVKNEVNVPCLKKFVETLYSQTLDMCTRNKHRLAIFPLVTCLLCVSQKAFFLHNWHYFLTMCLQQLRAKDIKMARVALEALYRLLWVYMIRIKCEGNNVTQTRLQGIVSSLFPKGSNAIMPRDTPLNIFVKIIQFIAQEKLDFAMKEIVFDLLSVGKPIKNIKAPERMSIGLRAFLVVADSLQQKEGEPPMPRAVIVMPSGSTLRVKKTFLNKMLTDETAKNIGLSAYYPYVRKVFDDILRALDKEYGKPYLLTNAQNTSKEADDAKPKIDLFRMVIAAIPRLIPDGMSRNELVDTLARLTVHSDEELRGLAYQSLQNLVVDFPDWREDVLYGFMQFVVKDILDQQTTLLDNAIRMVSQLLSAWRNAADRAGSKPLQPSSTNNASSVSSSYASVSSNSSIMVHRPDLISVLHMAEGFALALLCHVRIGPRRLSYHILKEVKSLFKILGGLGNEITVLDALDKSTHDVIESCMSLIPLQDKTAVQNNPSIEFIWLTERNSSQWSAGFNDEGLPKSGSSQSLFNADPWSACLISFLHPDRLPKDCPSAIKHTWPVVHSRLTQLFNVVDPAPLTDNRASLLRPGTAPKKTLNEKDISMHLWKNYITFACRVVPTVPNTIIRCVSPDLVLSSSPESLGMIDSHHGNRVIDNKSPSPMASPTVMYKLLVPLLRCEVSDMRDTVVYALGRINPNAIMDLMQELIPMIKEAIDKKTENMRRRRRRDALRLQLVKLLEIIAEEETFSRAAQVTDVNSGCLAQPFTDYIDGARQYLESEAGGDNTGNIKENVPSVREIKIHFASFIRHLIKSFSLEQRKDLLKKDLKCNLFYLFAGWSGKFGQPFEQSHNSLTKSSFSQVAGADTSGSEKVQPTEFELSALESMIAVLCCGSCFDDSALSEDGSLYTFLDNLLESDHPKVYAFAREAIVLLLEFNPNISALLDWVVDRCFTGKDQVADGCFLALATIFSTKEYPCDHYTAIINVTLMNTGCPRTNIHETALQLLQILDKRFFGSVSPLASDSEQGLDSEHSTLDVLLSTTYSRSQLYLSRQLAQLHPELTMPMFSEICHRLQTARHSKIKCLLYYLLPWLYNMELVDSNLNIAAMNNSNQQEPSGQSGGNDPKTGREGWGSAEATEMITNNLFYITVKFGDENPNEVEELWRALCACWTKNLKIIIRYLFIVSGMAPTDLMEYAKRVLLYLGRSMPVKTLEEMMTELETVETLNCMIERTETPPYYRLTSLRKLSDSESNIHLNSSRQDLSSEKGTIHTKRHATDVESELKKSQDSSGTTQEKHGLNKEQTTLSGSIKSAAGSMASSLASGPLSMVASIQRVGEKVRALSGSTGLTKQEVTTALSIPTADDHIAHLNTSHSEHRQAMDRQLSNTSSASTVQATTSTTPTNTTGATVQQHGDYGFGTAHTLGYADNTQLAKSDGTQVPSKHHQHHHRQPRPLPMPEYGGWFAPLTEFLPDASHPVTNFHRCNLAVILLTDLVVDGLDLDCHSVDWSAHVPLMLHIIFLGLDNSRELVYNHCHQLLLNLLIVLGQHNDHLTVSSVLMNGQTDQMKFGLTLPSLPILQHNFLEKPDYFEWGPSNEIIGGMDEEMETSGGTISEDDEREEKPTHQHNDIHSGPTITTTDADGNNQIRIGPDTDVGDLTKALIHFIASRKCQPMWQYEDITRIVWTIRSAEQLDNFLQYVLNVFEQSLPTAHLAERWSQLALQLALSCSSRHYAGRSLQIFRALRVPISPRMLSDILSRLVETIAEQGEDMQGYVTELFLTLEEVVDALDSDFRPMDLTKELFKSTPNLAKDGLGQEIHNRSNVKHSLQGLQKAADNRVGAMTNTATMSNVSSTIFNASEQNQGNIVSKVPLKNPVTSSNLGHVYHSSAPPTGPERNITQQSKQARKSTSPVMTSQTDIRGRSSTESAGDVGIKQRGGMGSNSIKSTSSLARSRSAQSLKIQSANDSNTTDEKMNILVQLFWICLVVLESDYEHEFLLVLRLLERVLEKLPLDRPDVREKIEKLQVQLKWINFPGAHSLLLKGCTNQNTYEATVSLLSNFTLLLDFSVVDPSQSLAFPMNVIAILPYMVQNYEDANDLCIESADRIADISTEKHKKLENLATVMTLYSRRTFSKESFQWTKCVVKYLYDLYSQFSFNMLGFLVEVLEKGPSSIQSPVLTIIHCLLHYVDMTSATQTINSDLLRTVAKFVESQHWKEALKILKLAVTRSSTLVAPPSSGAISYHWETASGAPFQEADLYFKKELPGRTMEFTFDLSQTPVIARRHRPSGGNGGTFHGLHSLHSHPGVHGSTGGTLSHMSMPSGSIHGHHHNPSLISQSTLNSTSAYGSYSIASTATLTSSFQGHYASAAATGGSVLDTASSGHVTNVDGSISKASTIGSSSLLSKDNLLSTQSSTSHMLGGTNNKNDNSSHGGSGLTSSTLSPKRSLSLTAADSAAFSGWKRPWMSQGKVRERLVNLLNTCGQRVGLPKSPSVIFSQTSELLERQSSMASSTEEVSGTNDLSIDSKQHDTTDTEQRFGMYMREFDFLEYELESLEGESVDNFNWGVRRPSLSHLEGGSTTSLSSASGFSHQAGALNSDGRDVGREKDKITRSEHRYKNSGKSQNTGMPNDHDNLGRNEVNQLGNAVSTGHDNHRNISPVLQNIGTNRNAGVGAEESSDDEMGSQMSRRSIDGISGASSISTTSSGIFPPTSLPLNSMGKMRSSTPQSETESASDCSDEGELSDHDLTPCNPSPSFPLHGWATLSGAGRGSGGCIDHDDLEEDWRNHVQNVTNDPTNETILSTFVAFAKLFNELKDKICVLTQDASVELTKENSTWNQELIILATDHLQTLTDILSEDFQYPHVWCKFEIIGGRQLVERIKFNILEIQENFENFLDKKEMTFECLDGIKAHQKLVSLGEHIGDYPTGMDIDQVDLCRYLYKLHFQLLMFLESFSKLLRLISQSHSDITCDKSIEVALIQNELKKVFKMSNLELEAEIQKNVEETPIANVSETKLETTKPDDLEILGLDETVESGVGDLQRIHIDDMDEDTIDCIIQKETRENELPEINPVSDQFEHHDDLEPSSSLNSSGNNSNDTLCPRMSPSLTSPSVSPKERCQQGAFNIKERLTPQESENLVVELITQSSWLEAVKTFKLHKQKWPETFSPDFENHIGTLGEEEDLYAMLNMYCKHLTEIRIVSTQPLGATCSSTNFVDPSTSAIFVMTLTDHDMANNVSRLMDASLQLLATVKLMETQLTKRKQSMSAQAVATVTERVYKQQEQVTQEMQQHHAQQQILQQEFEEKQDVEHKEELLLETNSRAPITTSDNSSDLREGQCERENEASSKSSSPQPEGVPKVERDANSDTTEVTDEAREETVQETEMTETIRSSL